MVGYIRTGLGFIRYENLRITLLHSTVIMLAQGRVVPQPPDGEGDFPELAVGRWRCEQRKGCNFSCLYSSEVYPMWFPDGQDSRKS